jgi:5'-3' exonuclease, N-terminal resolvase-like domain
MSIAIIDGDGLVYACAWRYDKSTEERGGTEEPIAALYGGLKGMVMNVVEQAGCDSYELYLSGPTNFRNTLYPHYKANRLTLPQPSRKTEARSYMRGAMLGILTVNEEADDACGIRMYELRAKGHDPVLISNDKDLNMIAGKHYNYHAKHKHKGVYEVTEDEAIRNFYKQVLKGDSIDNIPGLFRCTGNKATAAMLSTIDSLSDDKAMYEYCASLYKDTAMMDIICSLLWIKRDSNLFSPPTLRSK